MRLSSGKAYTAAMMSVFAAITVVLAATAHARWANVTRPVPVDRLLQNVGSHVARHPKDAQGYYVLGRLHSLAFAKGAGDVQVIQDKQWKKNKSSNLPEFAAFHSPLVQRPETAKTLSGRDRHYLWHNLSESIRSYRRATQLAPHDPLYQLGLAWMLEQGMPYWPVLGAPPGETAQRRTDAQTQNLWRKRSLAAYRRAYALALNKDLKAQGHLSGTTMISREAAEGILRFLKGSTLTRAEKAEATRVASALARLRSQPMAITPIIFPLHMPAPLSDLLTSNSRVRFDLAGNGRPGLWPWVGPHTGILVWDPKNTGRITSGQQLFGSATWWMFWKNGYQPLAALDDNRDGWLADGELKGIAVWQDSNGNAISEPGEVMPLTAFAIKRIAVRAEGQSVGVAFHSRGLERTDGSFLPSYDWTPTSLSPARLDKP